MVNLDYCIKDVHGVHVKTVTALFKLTKGYKSVVNIVNDEEEMQAVKKFLEENL